jgi:hypothetical protein
MCPKKQTRLFSFVIFFCFPFVIFSIPNGKVRRAISGYGLAPVASFFSEDGPILDIRDIGPRGSIYRT